ncbi:MAG TPA: chlorite dismutase, partial [bacterium]
MPAPLLVTFAGGTAGPWRVQRVEAVRGASLFAAQRLEVLEGPQTSPPKGAAWSLRGVTSNTRYTTGTE